MLRDLLDSGRMTERLDGGNATGAWAEARAIGAVVVSEHDILDGIALSIA